MGVGGFVSRSRSRLVSPAVLQPMTVLRYPKKVLAHAFVG